MESQSQESAFIVRWIDVYESVGYIDERRRKNAAALQYNSLTSLLNDNETSRTIGRSGCINRGCQATCHACEGEFNGPSFDQRDWWRRGRRRCRRGGALPNSDSADHATTRAVRR